MATQGGELYHRQLVEMLQAVWGEGFLSLGGPDEVALLVADADLAGLSVLDIGCGAGGIDIALARTHRARYVTGIDVEDTVLSCARASARSRSCRVRCRFRRAHLISCFRRTASSTSRTSTR